MKHLRPWPRRFAPLTPEQEAARNKFMKQWLEVLPQRYSGIERFNHGYPVSRWAAFAAEQPQRTIRTLEIGAGLGAHLGFEDLSRQEYYALEMREGLLDALRERYPSVRPVLGNIEERAPFDDAYFDRVVVVHVLEHLPNLPCALDEIRRLLKPDGTFHAVIPCEGTPAYSLARRISAQRIFERTYGMSYKPIIEREHVSTYHEIRHELAQRFRITHEERWPLRSMPLACNLVSGLTLAKL
jgi:SAM-dependent methyltransferase